MAGSDGSLIFDTDLDEKGFERGSARLQARIDKLVSSVNKIGNLEIGGAQFQNQVAQAKDSLSGLQQRLEELGRQTVSTANYEQITQSISKAEQALIRLVKRQDFMSRLSIGEDSAQWKRLELQIKDAEAALERLNAQKEQMETDGTAYVSGADTEQYRQLSAALDEARAKLEEYEAAQQRISRSSGPGILSGLKNALASAGSAALTLTKGIAAVPFKIFSSGAKSAVSAVKSFVSHSGRASSATRGLLRGLTSLKTMLFSRVKRMFISNIFNEMKESMNALQQFDKSFGTAMNNMKSAAKGLSANLAVSFGGLVSAIEPVLTKIISAISTAISYINALFAMLSGKGTVTVAKKQMNDYAKATGGAAGAAKELNKQLMGFDELNRLSDNGDSGGGGGGGANPADLFEEVPIDSLLPDSVKDYFERIKAAFEAGDWESIGSIIAEGLNSGMRAVDDWIMNVLRPGALTWSVSFADAINGFVNGLDWSLVGKTISDGLITVFDTISTFIENVNWQIIGEKTADMISAVDWSGVFAALSRGIGAALGALRGFIRGLIHGAWADVVKWWKDTAYKDGQFTMDGLLQGIKDKLSGIWSWIKTNIFEPFMTGFHNAFGINSPSTVMAEQGGYIIAGLLQGITGAWDKITGFFGTALSGLKTGLESAWAGVKTAAGSAWDAVKTAVTNPFNAAKTAINATAETIKSGLSSAWTNIKSTAGTAWDSVETVATTPFNSMKSTLTDGVSSLRSSLDTGWNRISAGATQAWGNISSDVSAKWGTLKSTLQNTNWSTVGINICNGIIDGLNNGWTWLVQTVQNIASGLLNTAKRILGIHSPSRVFRDQIGENIGLGLAEGIENSEKDVNRSVAALAKSTADGFGNQELSFNVAGSEMVSGLDRVADKLSAIANTFQAITAMLDSVGSLVVPEIATGTVAPYKTRISSTFNDDNRGDYAGKTDPAKIDNIINLLSEVIRVVKDIDPTVVIDEDMIGMAATRYQTRRARALGV